MLVRNVTVWAARKRRELLLVHVVVCVSVEGDVDGVSSVEETTRDLLRLLDMCGRGTLRAVSRRKL